MLPPEIKHSAYNAIKTINKFDQQVTYFIHLSISWLIATVYLVNINNGYYIMHICRNKFVSRLVVVIRIVLLLERR